MNSDLLIEPLRTEHLEELATQLRLPEVYQHIGELPSIKDFILDREIALRGPDSSYAAHGERWLDFLVRDRKTLHMLGRLEASLHDSLAEVAFLFNPTHWGKGYASEALSWLHFHIEESYGVSSFWATTVPANVRCQSLLRRAGYQQVHSDLPNLYSFDEGDIVFHFYLAP